MAAYLERRKISRKNRHELRPGGQPGQLGQPPHRHAPEGLHQAGAAGRGAGGAKPEGPALRQVSQPPDLPVIDVRGDVVAFGGRVLDKSEPKYLNTQETAVYSKRRNLYGINLAKRTKRPNFILCEGNIDVITLHQAGFDNAVASMGTALTTEQNPPPLPVHQGAGPLLRQRRRRPGGHREGHLSAGKQRVQRPGPVPAPRLQDGEYVKQDVDDFIKFQGPAAFQAILDGSENQMDYRMDAVAAKYDLSDGEAKIAYSAEIAALIASLPNAVEREVYAGRPRAGGGVPGRHAPGGKKGPKQAARKRAPGAEKGGPQRLRPAPAGEPRHPLRRCPLRHGGGGGDPPAVSGRKPGGPVRGLGAGGLQLPPAG